MHATSAVVVAPFVGHHHCCGRCCGRGRGQCHEFGRCCVSLVDVVVVVVGCCRVIVVIMVVVVNIERDV